MENVNGQWVMKRCDRTMSAGVLCGCDDYIAEDGDNIDNISE